MSHDQYASWATQEVARMLRQTPDRLFAVAAHSNLTVYANMESGRIWPIPDGRITVEGQNNTTFEVAVELKRVNEGLHGVLTAIGQSQAYIHKGYSGSVIIVPNSYDSFANPGNYVRDVINRTHPDLPIGVFSYSSPDLSIATPFLNRITIHRNIGLTAAQRIRAGNFLRNENSKTQWAHLREGSSDVDAFFRYLQIAKQLDLNNPVDPIVQLPNGLLTAVHNVAACPLKYLSNSTGDTFHDKVWRNFWFRYVLTPQVAELWTLPRTGNYIVNNADSLIKIDPIRVKKFFGGRANSIKNQLVDDLNVGNKTEAEAWEEFAQNIRNRAHSYREDIDSGLTHLGLLTSDGKPSDLGYQFVDASERTGDCHSGKPWLILGSAILKNGNLAAFLHYIYKVSESAFKVDPLRFANVAPARGGGRTRNKFDQAAYLVFLRNELANNLNVMNTAMVRGGTQRKAFQGEFAILRKFNFIQGFRIGIGLEINWPTIQEFLDFEL